MAAPWPCTAPPARRPGCCWSWRSAGCIVLTAVDKDLTALNGGLDIWMRLLQLILIVAFVGTLAAIWNAYTVATRAWAASPCDAWAVLIALAAAFLVWLCLDLGLLTASLNY